MHVLLQTDRPVDLSPLAHAALRALQMAAGLAGCAGILVLVLGLRFGLFEYTHGGQQTIVQIAHALSP
jgi:hypothetical protein